MKNKDIFDSIDIEKEEMPHETIESVGVSSFNLANLFFGFLFIAIVYQVIAKPILEEWETIEGLEEKISFLENYGPIVVVPIISLIKAFIQRRKKDMWVNFIISGILLFAVCAVIFSIHRFGLFNLVVGIEYFILEWFKIYLLAGAVLLSCVLTAKIIDLMC